MTAASTLPRPPDELIDSARSWRGGGAVRPALDLEAWVITEIRAADRPLSNYDFGLIADARVAFLWCTEPYTKTGTVVLGTCQLGPPRGNAWSAVRQRAQLCEWFGEVPDFLVTLDAVFFEQCVREGQPASALAVVEHELYHCGRKLDREGDPAFGADGEPLWDLRPHDIEEFAGVYRRYGRDTPGTQAFVAAVEHVAEHGPDIAPASLDGLCGTCGRSVA